MKESDSKREKQRVISILRLNVSTTQERKSERDNPHQTAASPDSLLEDSKRNHRIVLLPRVHMFPSVYCVYLFVCSQTTTRNDLQLLVILKIQLLWN